MTAEDGEPLVRTKRLMTVQCRQEIQAATFRTVSTGPDHRGDEMAGCNQQLHYLAGAMEDIRLDTVLQR